MSKPRNGLKRTQFESDRCITTPYKNMISKHGAVGREAIFVYEVAMGLVMKDYCFTKLDELFLRNISCHLQMSPRKVQVILDLILEYELFNKKLYQSRSIITSEAIQEQFFTIKKGFRYDIDTIPCELMLLPLETRMDLHIGLDHKERKVGEITEIVWIKDTCRLYNQKTYDELFVHTGREREMQLVIQCKCAM